jgi:hypothetical protein
VIAGINHRPYIRLHEFGVVADTGEMPMLHAVPSIEECIQVRCRPIFVLVEGGRMA